VAFPLTKLAHIHSLEGDHATADALFERALEIREGALGPDHPDLTWTLRPWGRHLLSTGNRARARRLYERALAIAEKAWGPEHIEVVFCLSEYGLLELADGNLARARSLFERALAIEREMLEPDNPHAQASLYWLACIESRAGNKERALERLRETVDMGWARPGSMDEPDLDPLRGDPRFQTLYAEWESRLPPSAPDETATAVQGSHPQVE
jgi:tetratricopeptide (TPR) repeat protein